MGAHQRTLPASARHAGLLRDRRSSWLTRHMPILPPPTSKPDPPVPLREIVALCLDDWGVNSSDESDSDEFCGWHVGSRVHRNSTSGRRDSGLSSQAPPLTSSASMRQRARKMLDTPPNGAKSTQKECAIQ